MGIYENNPSHPLFEGLGIQDIDEAKAVAKDYAKDPKLVEATLNFAKVAENKKVSDMQMQQIRQSMERLQNADQLAKQNRISENRFMQSLISQTADPQTQRQADIARPGLRALGNGDARNRFMQAQLQKSQNQVPVSSLGSQDFGRFASREGLDPKLSVARMEALRQAELASQPKSMTPEQLLDYQIKVNKELRDQAEEKRKSLEFEEENKPMPPQAPIYMEAAIEAIDDSLKFVEEDSIINPTVGFGSETMANIGGTDAANLQAALSTVTSAVGFKRLQDMRKPHRLVEH